MSLWNSFLKLDSPGTEVYLNTVFLIENLKRCGFETESEEFARQLIAKASSTANLPPQTQKILENFELRSSAQGKQLSLGSVEEDNKKIAVIAFLDQSSFSREVIESLKSLDYLFENEVSLYCVGYGVPETRSKKVPLTRQKLRKELALAEHLEESQYELILNDVPVDFGPYIILLNPYSDGSGKIATVNVHANEIRKMVEDSLNQF